MDTFNKNSTFNKPRVLVVSDWNNVTYGLLLRLLNYNFSATYFSNNNEDIKNAQLNFNTRLDYRVTGNYAYIIFIVLTDNCFNSILPKTLEILESIDAKNNKTVFVFPYDNGNINHSLVSVWTEKIISYNPFTALLFLGDVISDSENRLFTAKDNLIFLEKDNLYIKYFSGYLHPMADSIAVQKIINYAMSLKAYGKKTAVLGKSLSYLDLCYLSGVEGGQNKTTQYYFKETFVDETEFVESDVAGEIKAALTKTQKKLIVRRNAKNNEFEKSRENKFSGQMEIKKLAIFPVQKNVELELNKKRDSVSKAGKLFNQPQTLDFNGNLARTKKDHFKFKIIRLIVPRLLVNYKKRILLLTVFAIIFFFLTPVLFVFATLLPLKLANYYYHNGNIPSAKMLANISTNSGKLGKNNATLLTGTPFVGTIYKSYYQIESTLMDVAVIEIAGLVISENIASTVRSVFNNEDYQTLNKIQKLPVELEDIYGKLGLVKSEIDSYPKLTRKIIYSVVPEESFDQNREKLINLKQLSVYIPELLGVGKPTKYLLLFENNLIARPTGGKLEKAATVAFSNGKLLNTQIYNLDDIDNALKGEVEAPTPLKRYFNYDEWKFSEYNWEPDFTISSQKAAWFLNNSFDESFDGVVVINLDFIKNLYTENNSLYMENGKKAHKNNFIEIVMDEFAKGTDEIYFEKLTNDFITQISELSDEELATVLSGLSYDFEKRNIQLVINNKFAAGALHNLEWDGGLSTINCGDNCYTDYVAVIESEWGTKNTLSSVIREIDITISIEEGTIKRSLVIKLDNGDSSNKFEEYTRLYVPTDAGFGNSELISKEAHEILMPELYGINNFKVGGLYVQLDPGETKVVIYKWESGKNLLFEKPGSYNLKIRKQAGMKSFPVNIYFEPSLINGSDNKLNLTDRGSYSYNTELSKDYNVKIEW